MNFDPINDPINDPIKFSQKVELSDFDLSIVRIISEKPGLNAKQILEELKFKNSEKTFFIELFPYRYSYLHPYLLFLFLIHIAQIIIKGHKIPKSIAYVISVVKTPKSSPKFLEIKHGTIIELQTKIVIKLEIKRHLITPTFLEIFISSFTFICLKNFDKR